MVKNMTVVVFSSINVSLAPTYVAFYEPINCPIFEWCRVLVDRVVDQCPKTISIKEVLA